MAARSAASRLAAALLASRAARVTAKAPAVGAGSYCLYQAGARALTETVPYAADGGGGRRRFAPPAWLASMLPGMQPVRVAGKVNELQSIGPRMTEEHPHMHRPACIPPPPPLDRSPQTDAAAMFDLPPLAPGAVSVSLKSGVRRTTGERLENDWYQRMRENSDQALSAAWTVLAALQQEARSRPDGFGRHILVRAQLGRLVAFAWKQREGACMYVGLQPYHDVITGPAENWRPCHFPQ